MGKKTVILDAETKAKILAGDSSIEIELGEATPAPAAGTPPATPPTAPTVPAATVAADAGVVTFLTGEIAKKDAALTEAAVKIAKLEDAGKTNAEALPGLLAIAQAAIGNMQVALGGSDTSKVLTAADAVAEHSRIQPLYAAKFKPGGIAINAADPAPAPSKVNQTFLDRRAAMQANAK